MTDESLDVKIETPSCERCDGYLTGWKRALADYDNLKKDLGRERSEMRQAAVADAASRMIPVLDNFDTAVKFVPEEIDDKLRNWLIGILFVQTQLEEALRQMGLESFGEVGETFDANLHDAVGESPPSDSDQRSDQQISEVIARGWKFTTRIIRPAKVIITSSLNHSIT